MVITKLLLSLPAEYSNFHSAWDSTAANQQTIARLIMEETRILKQHENEMGEALVAKKFQKRTFVNNKVSSSNEKPGKCYFCDDHKGITGLQVIVLRTMLGLVVK